MTHPTKIIADRCIIPDDSNERFLPLDHPEMGSLSKLGVELAGISEVEPPYEVSLLAPRHHKLLMTLEGEARLITPGGEQILKAGQGVLLPTGDFHSYFPLGHWRLTWMHFHATCDMNWSDRHQGLMLDRDFCERIHGLMCLLLKHHWNLEGGGRESVKQGADLLASELSEVFSRETHPQGRASQARCHAWIRELHTHLHENWSVKRMAELMHCSSSQCYRQVKAEFGIAPMEVLANLRMERARYLLKQTDFRVGEVAERVGYENAFSFSRAFRRATGKSPDPYRRQGRGGS